MLPLPSSHNGSVEVRVSVFDAEIGANTVAYITVNMSPSANEPVVQVDSEESDLESLIFYILGFSVVAFVILIVLFVVLRDATSSPKSSTEPEAIPEVELGEAAPASVGLLARVKQQ